MDNDVRDDVISAALDGERVDVDALRRALATDEGRQSLAAFVMLRAASAGDDIAPAKPTEAVTAAHRPRPTWRPAGFRVPLAWAASIAIVAIAASFWFGTTLRAPVASLTLTAPAAGQPVAVGTPPIAITPVAIAPDCTPAPGEQPAGRSRVVRVAVQPPKPTRMLRFVPGVDWTSTPE